MNIAKQRTMLPINAVVMMTATTDDSTTINHVSLFQRDSSRFLFLSSASAIFTEAEDVVSVLFQISIGEEFEGETVASRVP